MTQSSSESPMNFIARIIIDGWQPVQIEGYYYWCCPDHAKTVDEGKEER